MTRCEAKELIARLDKEWVGADDHRTGTLVQQRCHSGIEVLVATDINNV